MAKAKGKKGVAVGAQSHIRARLTYLQKASTYLHNATLPPETAAHKDVCNNNTAAIRTATESMPTGPNIVNTNVTSSNSLNLDKSVVTSPLSKLSRQYISHMRGVSLKSQLRLPIEVKRSLCKRCDLLLTPGITCLHEMRNDSKGLKKPWADVFVVRCLACETEKRYPQTQKRSKKLSERVKEKKNQEKTVL